MRTLSWRRLFSGRNGVALLSGCFGILLSGCAGQDCSMVREDGMTLQLIPMADNAIRVKLTAPDGPQLEEIVFTQKTRRPKSQTERTDSTLKLSVAQLSATYSIAEDKITFRNAEGKVLLQESAHSREITAVDVMGQKAYQVTQSFISPVSEHLYGTGQFQDGYTDIRGLQRRLTQVNTQIALPMVISNKGYGLLWHNYSKTDFNPADASVALQRDEMPETSVTVNATSTHGNVRERRVFNSYSATINVPEAGTYSILLDVGQAMARKHDLSIDGEKVITMQNTWLPPTASTFVELSAGEHVLQSECSFGDKPTVYYNKVQNLTTLRSEAAPGLDYTVFAGGADQVISSFRKLSGPVPEMPDWMFGYIHCRERYNTQDELLANATEFHKRQIPVDVIVQDWQWWGKYGWNAMQFDEDRYPDPKAMTDSLHAMDIKLMLSVWSKIDQNCEVGKQMKEAGYYVPGTDWIDFFNPEASAAYWRNFSSRLVPTGIDAWWQDATEPENDDLNNRMVAAGTIPGNLYRNVYPVKVCETVYNGLAQDQPDRTPVILSRSAFLGSQRYGVVTWSGDVGNDFETLRRQIAGGLGQQAAGMPWWTYDAGGFFRPGNQYDDAEYQERMLRWIEASVFLPFMRVHGYMSQTEPWRYPKEVYDIYVKQIELRYSLMPYILECAKKVSKEGYTMMRPLVFDFANDEQALRQQTEFMFGPKYLVCPVTEYGETVTVYLPTDGNTTWKDFHSDKTYKGGRYITVASPLDRIPVFQRM